MRRATLVAVLSLAIVALGGATVSAHGRVAPKPTPTFAARAGTADQGGRLRVAALVKHAKPCARFSATAVVHFASGDVTVKLKRQGPRCDRRGHHAALGHRPGRGVTLVARSGVRVGATETPGEVLVDVTIFYAGQTVPLKATGLIEGTPPEEQEPTGEEPPGQQEQ